MTDERISDPVASPAVASPLPSIAAEHPFARAPLLAVLAAVASILDTFISRLAAPAVAPRAALPMTKAVFATGDVAMNLAAVAGLVALSIVLVEALRRHSFGSLFHRLTIAGFSGVFVPSIALAAILPRTRTTPQLVIFATGAAFVLAVLFGVSALQRRSPVPLRFAVGLVTTGAAASLAAMLCEYAPFINRHAVSVTIGALLGHVAEIAWIMTPVSVAVMLRPQLATNRGRIGIVAALIVGSLLSVGFRALRGVMRRQFGDILYYAFRVQLLLESMPLVYTIGISITVMLALVGLLASEPWRRQLGAALLLLAAAGVTPRMPGTLLMFVLGTMLLGRVAIALAPEEAVRAPSVAPTATTETP